MNANPEYLLNFGMAISRFKILASCHKIVFGQLPFIPSFVQIKINPFSILKGLPTIPKKSSILMMLTSLNLSWKGLRYAD